MLVYHEVSPNSKQSVLNKGLLRAPRGAKGDDEAIAKADEILDDTRPANLKRAGVSRSNNNYAYYRQGGIVIDILDGSHVLVKDFISHSQQVVLELDVNPNKCFVSDLDAFDRLKMAIENQVDTAVIRQLAEDYWSKIEPLDKFNLGDIQRPEVVIPYDVPPSEINLAHA